MTGLLLERHKSQPELLKRPVGDFQMLERFLFGCGDFSRQKFVQRDFQNFREIRVRMSALNRSSVFPLAVRADRNADFLGDLTGAESAALS